MFQYHPKTQGRGSRGGFKSGRMSMYNYPKNFFLPKISQPEQALEILIAYSKRDQ
jgi:hypothetical protein